MAEWILRYRYQGGEPETVFTCHQVCDEDRELLRAALVEHFKTVEANAYEFDCLNLDSLSVLQRRAYERRSEGCTGRQILDQALARIIPRTPMKTESLARLSLVHECAFKISREIVVLRENTNLWDGKFPSKAALETVMDRAELLAHLTALDLPRVLNLACPQSADKTERMSLPRLAGRSPKHETPSDLHQSPTKVVPNRGGGGELPGVSLHDDARIVAESLRSVLAMLKPCPDEVIDGTRCKMLPRLRKGEYVAKWNRVGQLYREFATKYMRMEVGRSAPDRIASAPGTDAAEAQRIGNALAQYVHLHPKGEYGECFAVNARAVTNVGAVVDELLGHDPQPAPQDPSQNNGEYRPATWFRKGMADRLRQAASRKRKTKRVATRMIDGVVCYSVADARQWWPDDVPKEA